MARVLEAAIRNNRMDVAAHAVVVSLVETKINGHGQQEIGNAKDRHEEKPRRPAGQSKRV